MLPVALQLFSIRESMEKDTRAALGDVADMGYRGVELCGFGGLEPKEFKNVCDGLGLEAVSAHIGPGGAVDDTDKIIDELCTVGAKYAAIAYLDADKRPGGENFESYFKNLGAAAKKFRKAGIQLLFHNHETEFTYVSGRLMLDRILEAVDDGLLLPELDTCWINIGGQNPEMYMKSYVGRCPVVHLKDFNFKKRFAPNTDGTRPDFEFRPIGYGMQDMPGILAASEEIGAKWYVVEQDAPSLGLSDMECAKLSRQWLKTVQG